MDDIFNVQPPAWLQDLTRPSEPGMAGKIIGELVGGMAIAAQQAKGDVDNGKSDTWAGAWLKRVPQGIAETRMNVSDPMWRLKAQQAELGMASTVLQMTSAQQQIDMRKQEIQNEILDEETIPPWMRDHNSPSAFLSSPDRPVPLSKKWQANMYRIESNAIAAERAQNQTAEQKIAVQGAKAFTDRVAKLPEDLAAGFVQYFGKVPSPMAFEALALAEQTAGQRKENERETARIQAGQAGLKPEFRITDKGVQETYRQPSASESSATFMPEEVTLPSGTKMIRVGPRQFRFSPKSGEDIDFTAGQLQKMAEDMSIKPDAQMRADAAKIFGYLRDKALIQTGQTNAPAAAPVPTKTAPKYSETNPAKPTTRPEFEALPSGTYFLNPSDGRLLIKK